MPYSRMTRNMTTKRIHLRDVTPLLVLVYKNTLSSVDIHCLVVV